MTIRLSVPKENRSFHHYELVSTIKYYTTITLGCATNRAWGREEPTCAAGGGSPSSAGLSARIQSLRCGTCTRCGGGGGEWAYFKETVQFTMKYALEIKKNANSCIKIKIFVK